MNIKNLILILKHVGYKNYGGWGWVAGLIETKANSASKLGLSLAIMNICVLLRAQL